MQGMFIDEKGIANIKAMVNASKKTRIVLLPLFKSYADALIMHYLSYLKDLELGFTFGNDEDTPNSYVIQGILKRVGYILQRRSVDKRELEISYVNQALLQEVIMDNPITTIFQNDERSRSGKLSSPNFADLMVRYLLNAQFELMKLKYDVKVVPVCIAHDRIFDSKMLSRDVREGIFSKDQNLYSIMRKVFGFR